MTRAAQGLRSWLLQRLTAIYLALYLLVLPVLILSARPLDFYRWQALFADPLAGIATGLFALALLIHTWVGVRDVLIDYVQLIWLRLTLMALAALVLLTSLLLIFRVLAIIAVTGNG